VLGHHYEEYSRPEIWILESNVDFYLPYGKLVGKEMKNRKFSKMEVVAYCYNQRVEKHNKEVDESDGQSDVKEAHITKERAWVILNRARSKLRQFMKTKGVF
jgi:hypothetical protein